MKLSTLTMVVFAMTMSFVGFSQNENNVKISQEKAKISLNLAGIDKYAVEISGPDQYYTYQTIKAMDELHISNVTADGSKFADGKYTLQITPMYTLTDLQKTELNKLRANNDFVGMKSYRASENLPDHAEGIMANFRISGGKFIPNMLSENPMANYSTTRTVGSPFNKSLASIDTEALYSTVNYTTPSVKSTSPLGALVDQLFLDDVIVDGSLCVGQDCVNGENFGFDTHRLKENNIRLHFDDTSASASFPSNDWRLTANDSSNGGASYLAIEDATAGTVPFRVMAGSGNNALYVSSSGGNVGMGTATPVVELHVTDGDSPTMRLEQNGSNGWTPQTWDVAGNETNFFVRDVTNGSKLPFKIRPGAPDNALYIKADGDIGLGTANPGEALQIQSGNLLVNSGNATVNGNVQATNVNITGGLNVLGGSSILGDNFRALMNVGFSVGNLMGGTALDIDVVNNFVGIGMTSPSHLLELGADDAVKPNGGSWSGPSDRRLKENIRPFTDGLNVLSQINPVVYNYNGKLNLPTDKDFIGVIAQEIQQVADYMVKPLHSDQKTDYLAFDPSSINYILVNAVQEQQTMIDEQSKEIDALKAQLEAMNVVNAKLVSLAAKVDALTADKAGTTNKTKVTED